MRFTRFGLIAVSCTMGAIENIASAGTVVYDNTSTDLGSISFTALQIGDEIQLAAPATVSLLRVGLSMQGFEGTGDVQAHLYANDGPGGQPGTLLWESDVMNDVVFTGPDELIDVAVPFIDVPATFTYTVTVSDTSPVAVGLPHFDPPAIGGSPDYAWFGSPGSWTQLTSEFGPVNFMAQVIEAAPDCPADLDGCGTVDFAYLLNLLSSWGMCPDIGPCIADIDMSGDVGFADLLILLASWGPCP